MGLIFPAITNNFQKHKVIKINLELLKLAMKQFDKISVNELHRKHAVKCKSVLNNTQIQEICELTIFRKCN